MDKNTGQVDFIDFDSNAPLDQKIKKVLELAILAPSAHNAQPWKLSFEDSSIKIFIDEQDRLRAGDLEDRETFLSIGCLLENILLLLASCGINASYAIHDEDSFFVEIHVTLQSPQLNDQVNLAKQIVKRRTNRAKYSQRKLPQDVTDSLKQLLSEFTNLHIIDSSEDKLFLVKLYQEAFSKVMKQKEFRRELSELMIPNSIKSDRGMPGYTIGLGNTMSKIIPWLLGRINIGLPVMLKDQMLIKTSPQILILLGRGNDKINYVESGRVLERIWLFLTEKNVSIAPLQAIIEEQDTRKKLKDFLHTELEPHVFVRMGYSDVIPYESPRKSLENLLLYS